MKKSTLILTIPWILVSLAWAEGPTDTTTLRQCLEQDFTTVQKASPCQSSQEGRWEKESYNVQDKTCSQYKAKKPIHDHTFFRFALSVGTYPDSLTAQYRLDSLYAKPPRLLAEDAKAYPLRTGLRCGKQVFVLSTDVAQFKTELLALASELAPCLCPNWQDDK